eukprot:1424921-Pleurochrysis_carterae.AAC.2
MFAHTFFIYRSYSPPTLPRTLLEIRLLSCAGRRASDLRADLDGPGQASSPSDRVHYRVLHRERKRGKHLPRCGGLCILERNAQFALMDRVHAAAGRVDLETDVLSRAETCSSRCGERSCMRNADLQLECSYL